MDEITIAQLWEFARAHHLENASIRVCDGMACSFYVNMLAVGRAPMEVVLDISACKLVEFDDLQESSQRVTFAVSR